MPAKDDMDGHLKALEAVLDEYSRWFPETTRRIFYPGESHAVQDQAGLAGDSFKAWLDHAGKTGFINDSTLQSLRVLHRDLRFQADKILNGVSASKTLPPFEEYNRLAILFDEFTGRLRRMERDFLLKDSGIDLLTGLRTRDAMEKDVQVEMERFNRQGSPFSIAVVSIDDFAELKKILPPPQMDECIRHAASLIKKCMRSFDEAYRLEDGAFVMVLKQTEASGAIKALNRIKTDPDAGRFFYEMNGQKKFISLSSCIGEPGRGIDISGFIANMRDDIRGYDVKGWAVLEHNELSPLQRYIKDNG